MDHKQKCIAIIALLLALVAISIGGSVITNESIFQIEVNNTNLAPNSSDSVGTGDRIQNVTYFANSTPIELFVFSHGATSGQNAEIHLTINGTVVADVAGKPLGSAEQNNYSIIAMIPRYASYSVQVNNFHHYEWREYRVISGQNGSIITNNYYNTTGGGADNASLNLKVNKSGDTMTGDLNMSYNDIYFLNYIISNNPINLISYDGLINSQIVLDAMNGYLKLSQGDGNANQVVLYENYTSFSKYIDMNGKNITNCGNCANTTDLNQKVNKSGDTMTGDLNINNAYLNLSTNRTFNFDFADVPKLLRNSTISTLRTAPLATLNMFLQVNGGIGNGGGPAIIFMNKDNVSDGGTEWSIGRFGIVWDNKTRNTSRADFYIKSGPLDTTGLTPGFSVYSNQFASPVTNKNSTLETGNLKLTNMTGTGNAYVCVDANGNLFRGSPAC